MNFFIKLIFYTSLISFLFLSPSFANDPNIQNIRISNSHTHLNLQFQLANSFNKKMVEAIKNGIPATFNYYINLYQHQSNWSDKLLISVTLLKTIKYDNLKSEYVITTKSDKENSHTTSTLLKFKEAKKVMNQVEIKSLYPMWKLQRNNTYYFKIKAESKGVEPPAYIHYLLFFLNWMNFETDWVEEKFTY